MYSPVSGHFPPTLHKLHGFNGRDDAFNNKFPDDEEKTTLVIILANYAAYVFLYFSEQPSIIEK